MTKVILEEIYHLLTSVNAVHNESEFCTDWLGKSECYLRTLRYKGVEASTGAVAICASKLQYCGISMLKSEEHSKLGRKFLRLSERCHRIINDKKSVACLNFARGSAAQFYGGDH